MKVETEISHTGGLNGLAMVRNRLFPTHEQLVASIPANLKRRSTARSLCYAVISAVLTFSCLFLGRYIIPFTFWAIPAWILYSIITGTVATGMWVVAHECGHGAFSDNKILQDVVGYVYHTILLVPYFSWQRSHAVHHSRTNHTEEGETHVPTLFTTAHGQHVLASHESWGEDTFGFVNTFQHLILGWPAYLLAGITGGSKRGTTNHFLGFSTGELGLFPTKAMKLKVFFERHWYYLLSGLPLQMD
jgi:omega-6 fatty acid desaturase (delta-12 desaturase)